MVRSTTDICLNCGCIYATHIYTAPTKYEKTTPKLVVPNLRLDGLAKNNPLTS